MPPLSFFAPVQRADGRADGRGRRARQTGGQTGGQTGEADGWGRRGRRARAFGMNTPAILWDRRPAHLTGPAGAHSISPGIDRRGLIQFRSGITFGEITYYIYIYCQMWYPEKMNKLRLKFGNFWLKFLFPPLEFFRTPHLELRIFILCMLV